MDSSTLFYRLNPQLTVRDRLERILEMKNMKAIPQVPWLDGVTNRRINKVAVLCVYVCICVCFLNIVIFQYVCKKKTKTKNLLKTK